MIAKHQPYKIKSIPNPKRKGRVLKDKPHKRRAEENAAAEMLCRFGQDVIFLKEVLIPGLATPDCTWRGSFWEIKTLFGDSYDNTTDALKTGKEQAPNIVLNGMNTKRDINRLAFDVLSYLHTHRNSKISRVLILKKNNYCLITKDMIK